MRTATCVVFILFLSGCANFKEAGSDLGTGLSEGVKVNADTIGSRLGAGVVSGARDTLTSAETQRRLGELVDRLGESLARQATASRDTLLGEYTRAWIEGLKNSLLGAHTKDQLGLLRDELLGARTNAFLKDSLRIALAGLRNEVLSSATQAALDSIIDRTMATLSRSYRDRMQPVLHEEEGFLSRNITGILVAAGGIVAAVIVIAVLVQLKRKKERNILDLLTYQIHEIPDQKVYDELTTRIQRRAQELGLEPRLRELLKKRGILGGEEWVVPESASH